MKTLLFLIFLSYISTATFAQQDSGFTNKAEATNLMVNGIKDGKWIEYEDENGNYTRKESSVFYELTIYSAGKSTGIARRYYNNGVLESESPYKNGKIDGTSKIYLSGKVVREIPYKDGKIDGLARYYYDTGILSAETPYTNGKINGTEKLYSEKGKLIRETTYKHGNVKKKKFYDENGNVL